MKRVVGIAVAALVLVAYDRADTPLGWSIRNKLMSGAATAEQKPSARSPCTPGGIIAGTLRNDGAGWYVLNDGDHVPINIASVETSLHAVTIRFPATARTVHTLIVTPDEVLARAGVSAGASVGLESASITLARVGITGPHRISPQAITTVTHPWSNLWVYGALALDCP